MTGINVEVIKSISPIYGEPCCGKTVGRGRSISIFFGASSAEKNGDTSHDSYAEWDIGTYTSSWRIVSGNQVICGSSDVADSVADLDEKLRGLVIGRVISVEMLSIFDIRVRTDNGLSIDFFCTSSDEDEIFHVFGPNRLYVEYTFRHGWKVGKSNEPWKSESDSASLK